MTATYVLVLFLGFVPPIVIEDYASREDCEMAGMDAASRCPAGRTCKHYCIVGPRR
jgi:hypothetical protein